MDVATIQTLVNSLGLPIVLIGAFCWFGLKVYNDNKEVNEKRETRNYEMLTKFQTSLDQFGDILAKYDIKLSVIEDKIDKIEEKIEG